MSELNQSTVQQLEALGSEALAEIVERYARDVRVRLAELGDALAGEDADRASGLLHALKGASLTVGADEVARLCVDGEARARARDWGALRGEFQTRLNGRADAAVAALRGRLTPKS